MRRKLIRRLEALALGSSPFLETLDETSKLVFWLGLADSHPSFATIESVRNALNMFPRAVVRSEWEADALARLDEQFLRVSPPLRQRAAEAAGELLRHLERSNASSDERAT